VILLDIRGKVKQKKDHSFKRQKSPFGACRKCVDIFYGQVAEVTEITSFDYPICLSKMIQKNCKKGLSFQFFY
jgi:hypothetical protein